MLVANRPDQQPEAMAHMLILGGLGVLAGAAARVLLGRLRRGARLRPPWCELAVGVLWAGAGGWYGAGGLSVRWLPLLLGLGWLAVAAGAVDVLHRRLPDALTLPALPAAVLLTVPLGTTAVGRAVLGAAVLFGAHLAVRLAVPGSLGAGDVKLAAALGAALGGVSWSVLVAATVLAAVGTASAVFAGLLSGRLRPGEAVPHGPAMLAAAWLVLALAAGAGAGTGA